MSKSLKEVIVSLPQEDQQAIRDLASSFDDFLKEQGIYDECEAGALHRVEEWKKLSLEAKVEYAKRLLASFG